MANTRNSARNMRVKNSILSVKKHRSVLADAVKRWNTANGNAATDSATNADGMTHAEDAAEMIPVKNAAGISVRHRKDAAASPMFRNTYIGADRRIKAMNNKQQ